MYVFTGQKEEPWALVHSLRWLTCKVSAPLPAGLINFTLAYSNPTHHSYMPNSYGLCDSAYGQGQTENYSTVAYGEAYREHPNQQYVSVPHHAQGPRPVSQSQLPDNRSHSQAGELADCASQAASLPSERDIFSSQSDLDKVLCDIALSQGSMKDGPPLTPSVQVASSPKEYSGNPIILVRFSTLLDQGLEKGK